MLPVLFRVGEVPIYSHGLLVLAGFLAGLGMLIHEARRRRWPKDEAAPIVLAAFVGGMVGARVSLLFLNGIQTVPVALNFFALFDPRIGPGSILGGVFGGYVGGLLVSRMLGQSRCVCDAFAPAMAIAMVIGRIGCYLAGEDGLGKPTTVPWAVYLPGAEVAVHPTPLYDAAFNLLWFGVLLLLRNRTSMQDGNLLKLGIGGYAAFRFGVEFLRNNPVLFLGLTPHQLVCLGLLAALAVYYSRPWWRRRRIAVPARSTAEQ